MYRSFNEAISKVSSGYSLSTEVSIRFSLVLFIAVLFSAVLTGVLERNGVDNSVEILETQIMESELKSMMVRVDQLRLTAGSLFGQAKLDATMVADYAYDNMNGTAGNTRFDTGVNDYGNYPMATGSYTNTRSLSPPGSYTGSFAYNSITQSKALANYYYSGWWRKQSYTFASRSLAASGTEHLMASRTMDNAFVPLLAGNPNYGEAYMGFENSFYRKVPYYDVSSYHATDEDDCLNDGSTQGYPCMYYQCQKTPKAYQHGYEPVCRTWYILAKADQSQAIFSPPYLGASKGLAMITVAKAVRVNETNTMIGVVGIDLYIDDLSKSVLAAKVLKTGYSYLIDKNLNIIMHPDATSSSLQRACDVEFSSCDSTEARAYDNHLNDVITKQKRGQWRFDKGNDEYWWIAYGPVNETDYMMIMTVPEAEVEEMMNKVAVKGEEAVTLVIALSIVLGLLFLFIGIWAAMRIAGKIAGPVKNFNSIMTDINNDHMDAINVDLAANEFSQINKLQSRILSLYLAVRFSTNAYYKEDFQEALKYLEEIENMFNSMKQKAAVGVVYNNKGEILRSHANQARGKAEVRQGDANYQNYLEAFRAIDLALANVNAQLIQNENKIASLNKKREKKHIQPGTPQDQPYREVEGRLQRRALKLLSTLGSRQSNKSLALKDAGDHEEALTMAQEAYNNYEKSDDLLGMIKVLGNKGLIFLDMSATPNAENCFLQAYNMANNKFTNEPSEETCTAFQFACMNMGIFRVHVMEKEKKVEDSVKHEALQYFYYAITVSNRVDKQVLRTCVHNIHKIFRAFLVGEMRDLAMRQLESMFPNILVGKSKVAFLVDVSPSMNGYERIIKAVDVLKDIVTNKMGSGDFFSMDIFSNVHQIVVEPCTLSSGNLSVILDSIHALQYRCTSGSTHFYRSLLEMGKTIVGMHRGSNEATKAANFTVLALTDGEDNEYRTTPQEVKNFYAAAGITLIVVTIAVSPRMEDDLRRTLLQKDTLLLTAQDDPTSLFKAMSKGFEMASGAATMESL